jgi:acetyl esterase/lipase
MAHGFLGRPDRRAVLGAAGAFAASRALSATPPDPTEVMPLWPGPPPGAPRELPREKIVDRAATSGFQDRYVTGVGAPLMTVFRPARPNGAAVLMIPGGGYVRVVIDKEGFEVGHRLSAAGITVFVLRYRLPGEGWARAADAPLQDAQRAVRLIRFQSRRLGIDAGRLAVLGASAGGHVAASLATRAAEPAYPPIDAADALGARPDLCALLYPVIAMSPPFAHAGSRQALLGPSAAPETEAAFSPDRHVGPQVPPTFLVHAWDDPAVPIENSLGYLAALRTAKVPAEAHLFEEGGHGFGIRLAQGKPAAAWPELFLAWASRRGLLG